MIGPPISYFSFSLSTNSFPCYMCMRPYISHTYLLADFTDEEYKDRRMAIVAMTRLLDILELERVSAELEILCPIPLVIVSGFGTDQQCKAFEIGKNAVIRQVFILAIYAAKLVSFAAFLCLFSRVAKVRCSSLRIPKYSSTFLFQYMNSSTPY